MRVPLASRDARLQVDEALYSTFARQVSTSGDWLLVGVTNLDKPPLAIWAISLSFDLFGVSEFSARLPNLAASILSLTLIYTVARRLYADRRVALLALLLMAASPFDRQMAATAFTDPLMTLFVLAACVSAADRRSRRSTLVTGIMIGLAFAVKESALQWLPLVIALRAIVVWSNGHSLPVVLRQSLVVVAAFAIATVPLILWSMARDTTPDFWTLNARNNTPGRFIHADEAWPRLSIWLTWLETAAVFPLMGWLCVPLRFALGGRDKREEVMADGLLTVYTAASFALIWLTLFNTYDRYLHPLVPLILILGARVLLTIGDRFRVPGRVRGGSCVRRKFIIDQHASRWGRPECGSRD